MSRKHFQMLADHMVATRPLFSSEDAFKGAVCMLASRLANTNPNFNFDLFVATCMED